MTKSITIAIASLALTGAALAAPARPTAGALSPDRLKEPSGPGSVRGLADEPSVDAFHGEVEYQVPIELPAGYGGLAPKVALSYSGALGNGPIGIGWTLALPRIERTLRHGRPTFDDTIDELEISGIASGRLVAIGGGEYRVEGMGQTVRVRSVDGGFEVDDGGGVKYRLGTSAASRLGDATHTQGWLVERETNLMGEQIDYAYTRDQGQLYPDSITWGPRATYRADFAYDPRSDATTSYRTGFQVVTAQRLATITTSVGGVERRAYELSYAPDDAFPVARLTGVSSTGVGHELSWPALSFTYASPAPAAIEPIAGIGVWRLNNNGTVLVDLDGDGAADLLQLAAGGHSYRLNQNGTFGVVRSLPGNGQSISAVQLQDIDGDARAELVVDTGSGWGVYGFTPTGWVKRTDAWPGTTSLRLKNTATTRFADLNGDGLVDGIQWDNDGLQLHMATRTGFLPSHPVGKIGGTALPAVDGRFQDVNGDGLDDYVMVAIDHIDEFLGHGDGTFEPARRITYPFLGNLASPQDVELADLDRDGLVDLVKIDTSGVRWFRGKPDGSFRTTALALANPESLATSTVVTVADTNGNGSQDVVWSSAAGMWRLDLAGTTTAGMLTEITNGLGLDVTFNYLSSHALAVAAAQQGAPWSTNLPVSMPVPTHKASALGPGETTRHVNYGVRDGVWDADEHRFAGFLAATVTTAGATAAETSTVTTQFLLGVGADRELRGKPQSIRIADGTGKLVALTTHSWITIPIAGLSNVPLLRSAFLSETQVCYDPNGCDVTSASHVMTDQTFEHDALGRTTRVVDQGRLDTTGDESVTETQYADDDTTWIRDRACERKVEALDGTVVEDVQTYFGDDTTQLALCVVGKGWVRETRAWLDTQRRWVTRSQTSYDVHGNPTTVVDHGVTRTLTYDADALFPQTETLGTLTWSATWDPVLAQIATVTDPNGHTTQIGHDALGRFTGVAVDGRAQHHVVEYDWTAPFPKTTTWEFDGALAEVTAKPTVWSPDARWRQTVEVSNGAGGVRYHAQRLADAQWIVSGYHEVDANGRVVFAGRPVLSPQLELSARPPDVVGNTVAYDALGRLIEQDLPNGAKRTASYLPFERTVQDTGQAPVHSVLDGRGRAVTTERSLSSGDHEIVQATYDAAGRLVQMSLAGGVVTRSFTYDTLGRLTRSYDPDLGARTLTWDDGDRLKTETNATGQAIAYDYDALGRVITRDTGAVYRYHYDTGVRDNLLGRLASIEEPTGGIEFGYDELGRTTLARQQIDDRVSTATTSYAASGLVLGRSFDDGFALTYAYDPAGRPTAISDLWTLIDQTASGMPKHETFGNGVDTQYERDVLDLPSHVTVRDGSGAAIYDVSAERDLASQIRTITDRDGVGLDHSATFAYDEFTRLTGATVGSLAFAYGYDVLHNMTSRTAPQAIGALAGAYHYGEGGHALRQLTSITAGGAVAHAFDYDAAGRQTRADGKAMTYDAADRLLRVDGLAGGAVVHAYGHDGTRLKTIEPDGTTAYFFGDGSAERNGIREHDVAIGDRIVARVPIAVASTSTSAPTAGVARLGVSSAGILAFVLALLLPLRRLARRRVGAAGLIGLALAGACGPLGMSVEHESLAAHTATYMHTGFGAGPVVFTDASGHLLEERRYEPFGVPIDAHTIGSGDVTGAPDLVARDLNSLNQRTEIATGWSDHGARWMAPETARWLTPDPLVMGPDPSLMVAPWALHPYQYVDQNPVAYWDPDGRAPVVVVAPAPAVVAAATPDAVATVTATVSATTTAVESAPVTAAIVGGGLATAGFVLGAVAAPLVAQALGIPSCGDDFFCWAEYGNQKYLAAQDAKGANDAIERYLHPGTSIAPAPTKGKSEQFVVRLQAQGDGVEQSVVLNQNTPVAVAQGLAGLETLKSKLSQKERDVRARLFDRAARFITNAKAGGGAGPPGQSFPLHPGNPVRVDVEILRGVNFKD